MKNLTLLLTLILSLLAEASPAEKYKFYFISYVHHNKTTKKWDAIKKMIEEKKKTEGFNCEFFTENSPFIDDIKNKRQKKFIVSIKDDIYGEDDNTMELMFHFEGYPSGTEREKNYKIYCLWSKPEDEESYMYMVDDWESYFKTTLTRLADDKAPTRKDIRIFQFRLGSKVKENLKELSRLMPRCAYDSLSKAKDLTDKYNFYFCDTTIKKNNKYTYTMHGDLGMDDKENMASYEMVLSPQKIINPDPMEVTKKNLKKPLDENSIREIKKSLSEDQ